MYRERIGLSQSELAKESGVSVRMIQHYEQRLKDLGRAQTKTIWLLARALRCSMEDLMEF
jgi:transcriptional regulator with XRE-family HTH domain